MGVRMRRRGTRQRVLAVLVTTVLLVGAAPGGWAPPTEAANEARIAHSADGVLLREEPSYGAAVLGALADGTPVDLRIDILDTVWDSDGETRWWPVATEMGDGWVAGFFLDTGIADEPAVAAADGDGPAEAPAAAGGDTLAGTGAGDESYRLAEYAYAQVADPDGVNLRAEPGLNGQKLRALRFADTVELRIDVRDTVWVDGSRWWPVQAGDAEGWISGTYLEPTTTVGESQSQAGEDADHVDTPEVPSFSPQSYVKVVTDDGGGLNIRADGAPDAERVGGIPEGDVVQVMDGPTYDPLGNAWYLATDGDVTGWVFGAYLVAADQPDDPGGEAAPAPVVPDDVPGIATGSFSYPLQQFTFTQGFGCSPYWFEPWNSSIGCNYHNGVDLAQEAYTPVLAADGGTVEQAGWCDCGLGYYVKIDHGNGYKTLYGHMAEMPYVRPGQAVAKGDAIGPVGSTGNSTGPHTHFIVQFGGVDQDPLWYLP